MNRSDAGHSKKNILLADLYKFDKFRKNSFRNKLLAIDYLPFYWSLIFQFFFDVSQRSSVAWLFQFALNPGSYMESVGLFYMRCSPR